MYTIVWKSPAVESIEPAIDIGFKLCTNSRGDRNKMGALIILPSSASSLLLIQYKYNAFNVLYYRYNYFLIALLYDRIFHPTTTI
jgi:hypothetical protein